VLCCLLRKLQLRYFYLSQILSWGCYSLHQCPGVIAKRMLIDA